MFRLLFSSYISVEYTLTSLLFVIIIIIFTSIIKSLKTFRN